MVLARGGMAQSGPSLAEYRRWVRRHDTIGPEQRAALLAEIAAMERHPLISVVMPVYNTPEAFLREALRSVEAQIYPYWQLCIADDASPAPHVQAVLREAAARDARIKVVRRERNGHISAASNAALELAEGEFVALMDHDDLLPPHALHLAAREILAAPEADLFFSDEDKVDGKGRRYGPYLKLGWNPELLLGQNLVSHLGIYRRSLLRQIGGLRVGLEGSQDWDLALRVCAASGPARIRHIPAILYHWRQGAETESFSESALERCTVSGHRAVADCLLSRGEVGARVVALPGMPGWARVLHPLPEPAPLASLILALPGAPGAADLSAILKGTDYPAFELLVTWPGAAGSLPLPDRRLRLVPAPAGESRAALLNRAADAADGAVLVLLGGGLEPLRPDWLREMVSQASRSGIAAVGAALVGPEGQLRHAGYVLGAGDGIAGENPLMRGVAFGQPGYLGHFMLARDVTGVSDRCMAIPRARFQEAGGLDAKHLQDGWADLDLCLRLRRSGQRVIWTPFAALREGPGVPPPPAPGSSAGAALRARWGDALAEDAFYSPMLSLTDGGRRLLPQPRGRMQAAAHG